MSGAVMETLSELQASMATKANLLRSRDIVLERQQTLREDVANLTVDILQSLTTLRESAATMHSLAQNNTGRSGDNRQTLDHLRACVVTKDDLIKYVGEIFEKQRTIYGKRDADTTRFRADVSQSLAMLKDSVVTMHSLAQNNAYSSEATLQTLQKLEGCMKGKEVIPEALQMIHDSVLAMQGLTRTNANANEADPKMYPGPAQEKQTMVILLTGNPSSAINAFMSTQAQVPASGYQGYQGHQAPYTASPLQSHAGQGSRGLSKQCLPQGSSLMNPYMPQQVQPVFSSQQIQQRVVCQQQQQQQQLQQLQQQQQQQQQLVAKSSVICHPAASQLSQGYSAPHNTASPGEDPALNSTKTPSENGDYRLV
ncbi:hypothetical protein ISF_09644 [Cordyceps fumosorosea ARSEF 2679]|uniref:Uncharacterized protein n=1 Tax=Cordyceps fumosorosea (strain ARSEF 2679) TaxID=1081104 RepID=A0A162LTN3_CORFA|nr:hypothetical protein ISF_09644 [Cordyceps fumosorosea ARSEF 2679]OAA44450.1 hypothetical protein ISF_09644 [Cordyceps fumosorosea ARSEF 2679]